MVKKHGKHKSLLDFIKQSGGGKDVSKTSNGVSRENSDYIDELTRFIIEASSSTVSGNKVMEPSFDKDSASSISKDIIDKLVDRSVDVRINCSQAGVCDDNRVVGQVFRDDYGLLRQRGYLKTTRLPVYLDFIVEKAVVKQILPNTYKVETDRGSIALVPEDFLCELNNRYGVILLNYDKCRDVKKDLQGFVSGREGQ
ncbi:MAG: hypothetical protein QXM54_02820 [Desulfurococcaceae archaeon]|uniref:Uncharacterized protein n=1 Tax=Staphylothermus marinus TaxID=2280 RepID=A0A7C4JLY0_STAMA